MPASIDELQIDINAQANRANKVIDTLCSKIDRLTVSMNHLDGSKLGVLANGVQRLGTAMQTMNNVKTSDFTRLANNLSNLNKLDVSNISKLSASVNNIGTAFKNISGVPESVKNITKLTDSISRLSSANVKGLENVDFSKIGNSINLLANSLSNAPKIQQSIISMTNAVGNLAKSGDKIPIVSSSLGSLGTALNKFIYDMSNGVNISDSTINFANAIGVLAKSGNTMSTTTSNLSALGVELKKLMKELSTAPKVSQNIIDMTNALAKLARTGSSSGKAANSLVSSFNRISKASSGMKINLLSAVNGISAIRKSILQAMGIAGGFYAVFQGIKESINIASDLTEVQNVVDVTFGDFKSKIEDLADVSIPELGMSELTTKNIASRFQAMGTAMGFTQGKMADMSVELTRLTGDMASFYNVEQKAVGEDLESIFTGQTKPLRQYGLDLTEATLQEWAMKQGMDANINSMSQMEKTMLRYQYVMANTGAAQGDFLRTQDTWANQVRILKENFRELASVIGSSFINALKPLVKALNTAMSAIISFAKVVSNALGKIFGWKYEDATGGIASDFEDAAEGADGLASGTGKAADNAKKLKQQLQRIDELNVLSSNNDTGTGGGSGGGGGAGGSSQDASGGQWTKTDGILKDFESSLDTLYKLGEYIGNTITDTLNSIDWDSVYEGARNFGSGLASFLNGLISPELFYATGKTIANSLNTAIYAALSFGETFDFADFGNSIANGINGFFQNFDFKALAETLNTWVDGIETTIVEIIKNVDWLSVIKSAFDFATTLDIDTIAIAIGTFKWFHGGKEIVSGALNSLLSKQIMLGIGEKTISVSTSIGLIVTAAIVGWKLGDYLYNNVPQVHEWSEFIVGEIGDLLTGQNFYDVDMHLTGEFVFDTMLKGGDALFEIIEYAKEMNGKMLKIPILVVSEIKDKISNTIINIIQKGKDIKQKIIASITNDDENSLISWIFEKTRDVSSKLTKDITTKLKNGDENSLISWVMKKIKNYPGSNLVKNITSTLQNGNANNLITWVMNKIKSGTNLSNVVKTSLTNASPKSIISWLLEKIMNNAPISKTITTTLSTKGADALEKVKGIWDRLTSKTISITFSDAFSEPIKRAWNRIADVINKALQSKVGKRLGLSKYSVPKLATGGMLDGKGQLFIAREKGPELVTSYGNKSAVMNNNQIVESVSGGVEIAVRNANAEQIALLRQQNELLYEILQKETGISSNDIFNSVRKSNNDYKAINGHSALA